MESELEMSKKTKSPAVKRARNLAIIAQVPRSSFTGKRCPKCLAMLLSNGKFEWCPFVAGKVLPELQEFACDYCAALPIVSKARTQNGHKTDTCADG